MSSCCYQFTTNQQSATRTGGPVLRPLDGCNNKVHYNGKANSYGFGTFVKPTDVPNEVEPTLDAKEAIGMSVCIKTTTADDTKVETIRTGRVFWSDIAEALGKDPTSKTDWWPIHVEAAKIKIFVQFA